MITLTYIGPKATEVKKREEYLHRLNETSSLTDQVFQGHIRAKTAEETLKFKDPAKLVGEYIHMIEDHVDRRVAIFFQQLVVVYNTKLEFTESRAAYQAESAPALILHDHKGKQEKLSTCNAAHSSTLPRLIANGCAYIEGSDIERGANTTLAMPRHVNVADIGIDAKLRGEALSVVNRTSKGTLNPVTGLKRFLQIFLENTTARLKTEKKPGVKAALLLYKPAIEAIQVTDLLVEQMLGIRIKEEALRETAYEIRYQAIRECQLGQSELVMGIKALSKEILKGCNKPVYFEEAFRAVLKEELANPLDRLKVNKMLNDPGETPSTKLTNAKKVVRAQLAVIKPFAKLLTAHFSMLKEKEELVKEQTAETLRKAMKWSKKELAEKMDGKSLAEAFGVDETLFTPSFYYS